MKDRVAATPNRYAVYDDDHNFLRYEYHERADNPTEVGTPLSKANLLPDASVAAFSPDAPETVGAALALLGRLNGGLGNEYVWEKSHTVSVFSGGTFYALSFYYQTVYYSNSQDMSNPSSVYVELGSTAGEPQKLNVLAGKFFRKDSATSGTIYYGQPGTTGYQDQNDSIFSSSVTWGYVDSKAIDGYVNSPDPTAYPPAVSDGYTYTALGQVGGCVHIVRGGYVGTRTYGASNPTTYTLQNPNSKVVVVYGRSDRNLNLDWFMVFPDILKADAWTTLSAFIGKQSSLAGINIKLSASGVLSIYGESVNQQFNDSGETYTVLEIL